MKVTVSTITFRPVGSLVRLGESLRAQTMPPEDFEWIIVDDHAGDNRAVIEAMRLPFRVVHIPPFRPAETSEPSAAINDSLIMAGGDLVHLTGDYMTLSSRVLERHWQLYEEYGPDVIISGPMTSLAHRQAEPRTPDVMIGDGVGQITNWSNIRRWYWASKNDSACLEKALGINGLDESLDVHTGGADVVFAASMISAGCRYLADLKEPAWEHGHEGKKPARKSPRGDWAILFDMAMKGATGGQCHRHLMQEWYAQRRVGAH